MIFYDFYGDLRLLLYSLAIGLALASLWDITRLLRVLVGAATESLILILKAKNAPCVKTDTRLTDTSEQSIDTTSKIKDTAVFIAAIITDIGFFIISALTVAVFIFHANTGRVRGYLLIGCLVGFMSYLATLGRLTMPLHRLTSRLIVGLASLFARFIAGPILRVLTRTVLFIYRPTLGRLLARIKRNKLRRRRDSVRRELLNYCERLGIIVKERLYEGSENDSPDKARDILQLRRSDNHLREHSDQIQRAHGEARLDKQKNRSRRRIDRRA